MPPTGTLALIGVIVMLATFGAVTLSTAEFEVFPKAIAVMFVLPVTLFAVASPFASRVAMFGRLEFQVTLPAGNGRVSPAMLMAVAENCCN